MRRTRRPWPWSPARTGSPTAATACGSVDWKAKALAENDIDPARVHFVGRLGRRDYLRLLQRSDAHVYLTVPFVLSWSMLEAMSTGCALVLSDTEPVREFADPIDGILGQYGQSSGNLQRSRRNALKQKRVYLSRQAGRGR